MSKEKLRKIKQEVKEKALAKLRWQWFKAHKKLKNVSRICQLYGISRSQFYYWKKRLDLMSSRKGRGYSKIQGLLAYSRKPKTSPREYPPEAIRLIIRIRKRTNRGADHIWFILRDKYQIYVSVAGIYKTLKREGLIKERRHRRKQNKTYEAPKCLPGEKIQIDVKYVRLADEIAERLGKKYRWVYQHTALDVATGIKCKMIYEHQSAQIRNPEIPVNKTKTQLQCPKCLKLLQSENVTLFRSDVEIFPSQLTAELMMT